jgi:hypothetical protein
VGLIANVALFAIANKVPVWLHLIVVSIQVLALVMVLAMWGGGI